MPGKEKIASFSYIFIPNKSKTVKARRQLKHSWQKRHRLFECTMARQEQPSWKTICRFPHGKWQTNIWLEYRKRRTVRQPAIAGSWNQQQGQQKWQEYTRKGQEKLFPDGNGKFTSVFSWMHSICMFLSIVFSHNQYYSYLNYRNSIDYVIAARGCQTLYFRNHPDNSRKSGMTYRNRLLRKFKNRIHESDTSRPHLCPIITVRNEMKSSSVKRTPSSEKWNIWKSSISAIHGNIFWRHVPSYCFSF